eukprot:3093716-Prymnesium_polylepis.2
MHGMSLCRTGGQFDFALLQSQQLTSSHPHSTSGGRQPPHRQSGFGPSTAKLDGGVAKRITFPPWPGRRPWAAQACHSKLRHRLKGTRIMTACGSGWLSVWGTQALVGTRSP